MRLHRPLLAALLAGFGAAAAAGTVEVAFADITNFTDIGKYGLEEQQNADALARHLQLLGQRMLPAGHVLKVEVLDVDMAGTVRETRKGTLRTVKGGADFPSIRLRYTLQAPGQPARSGEEHLSDIHYTSGVPGHQRHQELYYEKRLLEKWMAKLAS